GQADGLYHFVMEPRPPDDEFATTHWSLVLQAGKRGSREADEALAALCRRYWFPLYAYARRRLCRKMRQVPGCSLWLGHVGDARDLRGVLSAGILAVVDLAL